MTKLLVGSDGSAKMSKSLDNYIALTDTPEMMFGKTDRTQLLALSPDDFGILATELPAHAIPRAAFAPEAKLTELLVPHVLKSSSDLRREIQAGALSINKIKVTSHETTVATTDLLHNRYLLVEVGKKNKQVLVVE